MIDKINIHEFFDGFFPVVKTAPVRISLQCFLLGCLLLGSVLNWLPVHRLSQPLVVVWDGDCNFCRKWTQRIARLDWLKRLRFVSSNEVAGVPAGWIQGWTPEIVKTTMWVKGIGSSQAYTGLEGFRRIAWVLPLTWLILPLLYLPGVSIAGNRIYRGIADNRHRLGCDSNRCELP